VFVDDEPIGRQDLASAADFDHLGHVQSGSVLLNTHRRLGYGTHARACALSIAWELGASRAHTAWRVDNEASARVSEKLGYVVNGTAWWWDPLADRSVELRRAHVDRAKFLAAWPDPVAVSGVGDDARTWIRAPGPDDR
jgi:RimJ/RimL family protein N-acetyltransferase